MKGNEDQAITNCCQATFAPIIDQVAVNYLVWQSHISTRSDNNAVYFTRTMGNDNQKMTLAWTMLSKDVGIKSSRNLDVLLWLGCMKPNAL